MRSKRKGCVIFLVIIEMLLLTSCGAGGYTMQQEVDAWNEATERTLSRYNQVKELSLPMEQKFIDLFVFNKYDESLEQFFEDISASEQEVSSEEAEGYNKTFLQLKKEGVTTDAYDVYFNSYASSHDILPVNLYQELMSYDEKYGMLSIEDKMDLELDMQDNLYDFLYYSPQIKEHKFFTALHSATVTEVYVIEGSSNATVSVVVLWSNNKIIGVSRKV